MSPQELIFLKKEFANHGSPKAIILDVRGTILDPTNDWPVNHELLKNICACIEKGISIALITGCSLKTVINLILEQHKEITCGTNNESIGKLYLYTGTGCQAFLVGENRKVEPLENYEILTLNKDVEGRLIKIIHNFEKKTGVKGHVEIRQGQINYYCQASRSERNLIANQLRVLLRSGGYDYLHLIVPTAKSVIDISLSTKKFAAMDFIHRANLKNPEKIVFISDSLQIDGGDISILSVSSNIRAYHVGPKDSPIASGVTPVAGGPKATSIILLYCCESLI